MIEYRVEMENVNIHAAVNDKWSPSQDDLNTNVTRERHH